MQHSMFVDIETYQIAPY